MQNTQHSNGDFVSYVQNTNWFSQPGLSYLSQPPINSPTTFRYYPYLSSDTYYHDRLKMYQQYDMFKALFPTENRQPCLTGQNHKLQPYNNGTRTSDTNASYRAPTIVHERTIPHSPGLTTSPVCMDHSKHSYFDSIKGSNLIRTSSLMYASPTMAYNGLSDCDPHNTKHSPKVIPPSNKKRKVKSKEPPNFLELPTIITCNIKRNSATDKNCPSKTLSHLTYEQNDPSLNHFLDQQLNEPSIEKRRIMNSQTSSKCTFYSQTFGTNLEMGMKRVSSDTSVLKSTDQPMKLPLILPSEKVGEGTSQRKFQGSSQDTAPSDGNSDENLPESTSVICSHTKKTNAEQNKTPTSNIYWTLDRNIQASSDSKEFTRYSAQNAVSNPSIFPPNLLSSLNVNVNIPFDITSSSSIRNSTRPVYHNPSLSSSSLSKNSYSLLRQNTKYKLPKTDITSPLSNVPLGYVSIISGEFETSYSDTLNCDVDKQNISDRSGRDFNKTVSCAGSSVFDSRKVNTGVTAEFDECREYKSGHFYQISTSTTTAISPLPASIYTIGESDENLQTPSTVVSRSMSIPLQQSVSGHKNEFTPTAVSRHTNVFTPTAVSGHSIASTTVSESTYRSKPRILSGHTTVSKRNATSSTTNEPSPSAVSGPTTFSRTTDTSKLPTVLGPNIGSSSRVVSKPKVLPGPKLLPELAALLRDGTHPGPTFISEPTVVATDVPKHSSLPPPTPACNNFTAAMPTNDNNVEMATSVNSDTVPVTKLVATNNNVLNGSTELQKKYRPRVTRYACNKCNYKITKLFNFRLHMAQHCSDKEKLIPIDSGSRKWRCGICGYFGTTARNLRKHVLQHAHQRRFLCGCCDQDFRTKDDVYDHFAWAHHRNVVFYDRKLLYEAMARQPHMAINLRPLVLLDSKVVDDYLC